MTGQKLRILIVDDCVHDLWVLYYKALEETYGVVPAKSVGLANEVVLKSIKSTGPGARFSMALIDLSVGSGSGGEFARRLRDIFPDINVVIVTDDYRLAMKLPFEPDCVVIKNTDRSRTSLTLLETVKSLSNPIRVGAGDPLDVKLNLWRATSYMGGINELKLFTQPLTGNSDARVEKLTSVGKGYCFVNTVVYPGQPEDKAVPIAVQSTVGCNQRCRFCQNWRSKGDDPEQPIPMRLLTCGEIVSQVYLAVVKSAKVKEVFRDGSQTRLVINFTGAGDALVNNLDNCLAAVKQLERIRKTSFIITSVGSEAALQKYLDLCLKPRYSRRIKHYWSVNSLDPETRDWLMPGTKGQSLEKMRDLYERIANESGRSVTASFALFEGVNNTPADVRRTARFFADWPFGIKLMAGCPGSLSGSPDISIEGVEKFREKLIRAGVEDVRVREIHGIDGNSGCGGTEANFIVEGRPRD